jgi:hypothetical protein
VRTLILVLFVSSALLRPVEAVGQGIDLRGSTFRVGLSSLISIQCLQAQLQLDCLRLQAAFAKALDAEPISWTRSGRRVTGAVVFRRELLSWLRHPLTQHLLVNVQERLASLDVSAQPYSLFESVEADLGRADLAISFLATLFQDISPGRAHLRWARAQNLNAIETRNISELDAALDRLWLMVDSRSRRWTELTLFPRALADQRPQNWNGKMYHFYVPAHLASILLRAGLPSRIAVLAAHQFNLNYELLAQGTRGFLLLRDQPRLLSIDTQRDVMMGLEGALFGLSQNGVGLASQSEPEPAQLRSLLLAHLNWWYEESRGF